VQRGWARPAGGSGSPSGPVLHIVEVPAGPPGGRRVELSWQDGVTRPRVTAVEFADVLDQWDHNWIRWYLEDYPQFPADPAPMIAAAAEARLAEAGAGLFRRVFSNVDAAGIWERARDQLSQVRVEVDTDPGWGPGAAWELLRDPRTSTALVLGAGEFVRTHRRAAGHPDLPEPSGDRLRVLMVITRPGGRADAPFRSVASRLVRGGADQMGRLDLDVLRPPTFDRLRQVLRAAHDAGRPYHVVHFDGHGTWLDLADLGVAPTETRSSGEGPGGGLGLPRHMSGVSIAGPVRRGHHGYLIFEDPDTRQDQQLVDGSTLGRLLAATDVPVAVLGASRSAYAEAPDQPDEVSGPSSGGLTADVHARIRAYGSLAAEVADAGVPGVVAMRYNVYVVTAAQFMADMYAHLLAGKSLGQAVRRARRALADAPVRQIGATPVSLQDWAVPVVYESAPLVLLEPEDRHEPLIRLTPTDSGAGQSEAGRGELPPPPDAGFFGRDETLLALDRAFDTQQVVLLHAFAGAGKTSTAAEFARWYRATGGLDHPQFGAGPVLWSSFEHYLTADRLLDTVADTFSPVLEANGIHWQALTDPAQRRSLMLQVLAQVPVLWVWDNVEPVSGFPEGTPSAWTQAEQDDLVNLLQDLAQHTRCKVLVTSRRDERAWLDHLPARVQLPPMPIRESLQLARALADRRGHSIDTAGWRPLLRYAGGNPLTIRVAVAQVLREGLTSTEQAEGFVAQLQTGEAQLEAGQDAALGRTRSLAASLSYGFAAAFSQTERAQLAVLHLFRDTADADALPDMGNQETLGQDAVPELAGLDRDAAIGLLDRAVGIGLLESLGDGSGYYRIHPALPWYLTALFTASYGPPGSPPAQRTTRAYTRALGDLGGYYRRQAEAGREAGVIPVLGAEEANLRHALTLARADGLWEAAAGCLQGLHILYPRTGRDGEWARLVTAVTTDFTDPDTGGPLPGRDDQWALVTGYRVGLAEQARDWPAATTLATARTAWDRDRAAAALAAPPDSLTPDQRTQIRNLAVSLEELGQILRHQDDPGCLPYYQEALGLCERIRAQHEEAGLAINIGNAYLTVPGLRDLGQAENWFRHSMDLRPGSDQHGRATSLGQLGSVALARFDDARAAGEAQPVLLEHLNTALAGYQEALGLTHADDHEERGVIEQQLGNIYGRAGDTLQAFRYYQQALQHMEARGDIYGAGQVRDNIALLLADDGQASEALLYARAALDNFLQAGAGAAADADSVRQVIADIEQHGTSRRSPRARADLGGLFRELPSRTRSDRHSP
jgi:tetratricopeptide (TPR) repeat protein